MKIKLMTNNEKNSYTWMERLFSARKENSKIIFHFLGIRFIFKLKQDLRQKYCNETYSQDGEDVVLNSIIHESKTRKSDNSHGFYVDIGAHHPFRFSNTQLFYKKGWTGINIDGTPHSMELFNKFRPRDVNLEVAISDKSRELTYYCFDEPALNGFDCDAIQKRIKEIPPKTTIKMMAYTINSILQKYLPTNQHIDFISMDIEGMELKVLESFDFSKYAPDYFLIEELNSSNQDFQNYGSPIVDLLRREGYIAIAKTYRTVIWKRKEK